MVEAFGESALAEGSIDLRVSVLGIDLELEPFLQLRGDVGGEVVAVEAHLGIAHDPVLGIVAPRDVVLGRLATTAQTEVVALLASGGLVVKLEVIDVPDPRL